MATKTTNTTTYNAPPPGAPREAHQRAGGWFFGEFEDLMGETEDLQEEGWLDDYERAREEVASGGAPADWKEQK